MDRNQVIKAGGGGCGHSLTHIPVWVRTVTFCCFGHYQVLRGQETELASCPLLLPWLMVRLGWVSSGVSCVGSNWVHFYLQVIVCRYLAHLLFQNALMECYSKKRKIFHSYVCVIQMIFLKIYFYVFTMFLNNLSISTVKDKTRGTQNLVVHILEYDCLLTSPGLHFPSSALCFLRRACVSWFADWETFERRPS